MLSTANTDITLQGRGRVIDHVARVRQKGRFIIELRYPAATQLLDSRGKVVSALRGRLEARFPHWGVTQSQILFTDRPATDKPACELAIMMRRMNVIIEDPGTLEDYWKEASGYLRAFFDALQPSLRSIDRIGVRLITIAGRRGAMNYEEIRKSILTTFHKVPLDLPLEYQDSMSVLVHKHGQFVIMPVRRSEEWVSKTFRLVDGRIPEVGYAMDVDSFSTDLEVDSASDLLTACQAVLGVSQSVEQAMVRALGLADV